MPLTTEQYIAEVLSKLKLAMKHYKVSTIEKFNSMDDDGNYRISIDEFGNALKEVDPTLTAFEIAVAFNKFDTDKSGYIDYREFYTLMDKIQLPKEALYITKEQLTIQQKEVSNEQLKQLQNDKQKVQSLAEQAVNKLKQAIIFYKIDVKSLFKQYDTNPDGQLDIQEFAKLITIMEPNIQYMDILVAFSAFDTDQNYFISYQEFLNGVSK